MKKNLLIVQGGARDGLIRELPLPPATLRLGRGPGNDIQFDPHIDKLVGRQHARVEIRRDGVYLVDENSANGTFHSSPAGMVSVRNELKVSDKDRFRLGSDGAPYLVFEFAASTDAIEPPDTLAEPPDTLVGIKVEAPRPIAVQASWLPPAADPLPHGAPAGRRGDTIQAKVRGKPGRRGDTLVAIPTVPQDSPTLNLKQEDAEVQPQVPAETLVYPTMHERQTQVKLPQVSRQVTPQPTVQPAEDALQKSALIEPPKNQPMRFPTGTHPWAEYRSQGMFITAVLMFACLLGLGLGFSGMLAASPPAPQEVTPN